MAALAHVALGGPLVPGFAEPVRAAPPGGGAVTGVPPEFQAFTPDVATADNSGSSLVVFTGRLFDANGESHFTGAMLEVVATGVVVERLSHVVTEAETQTAAEPATFGADGFKVYSETLYDGTLFFQLRYRVAAGTTPGEATFRPTVTPVAGRPVLGPSATVTVTVFSQVTISAEPVDAAGLPSGTVWGQWSAAPGASGVDSVNYLKAVNTGQEPTASVAVSFSDARFTGPNPNFSIPIHGNVRFAWCEVASESLPPSSCTFTFGATSADGSVTASFSAVGRVLYVQYRIVQVPSVAAEQTYGATYTATEV